MYTKNTVSVFKRSLHLQENFSISLYILDPILIKIYSQNRMTKNRLIMRVCVSFIRVKRNCGLASIVVMERWWSGTLA